MLELRRAPRENWDVIYVDVESGDDPADCIAAIIAALAANPQYRSRFESIPFSNAIKDVFGRLSAGVDIGIWHVELKQAIGREWETRCRPTYGTSDESAEQWQRSSDHH